MGILNILQKVKLIFAIIYQSQFESHQVLKTECPQHPISQCAQPVTVYRSIFLLLCTTVYSALFHLRPLRLHRLKDAGFNPGCLQRQSEPQGDLPSHPLNSKEIKDS
jgi:hypothetical protein